jgi:hypothetical protein
MLYAVLYSTLFKLLFLLSDGRYFDEDTINVWEEQPIGLKVSCASQEHTSVLSGPRTHKAVLRVS